MTFAKALHTVLERVATTEDSAESGGLEFDHLPSSGTLGGSCNCLENISKPQFIDCFRASVGVLGDLVNDVVAD
jgi:hypothetical protein